MRRQNLTTASLQVFVHTNRFRVQDARHFATQAVQLPVATADTGKLTSAALRGVGAIWKQGYRYNKAGVIFLDLRPATEVQGTLFDQPDTPARKRLMRVLDGLNARFGRDTVTYAACSRHAIRPIGKNCCPSDRPDRLDDGRIIIADACAIEPRRD
jgi:DNA polymerase V